MDEEERRRRCREKFDRGELPRIAPERILVNEGTWERCALCEEDITDDSREYELQFALRFGLVSSDLVSFRFHHYCFATWLVEHTR